MNRLIRHRKRPAPALIALLAAASLVAAGCGDDGSGRNPERVLQETFSGDGEPIESGVIDLGIKVTAEGGEDPGVFDIRVSGPFDFSGEGIGVFDFDLAIDADAGEGELDFSAGIASTGESAFVRFEETAYSVPQEIFDQFVTTFTELQEGESGDESPNLLGALGIDPTKWLTGLTDEGTEDVGGTETVHIRGEADVPKLIADLRTIARQAGDAVGGPADAEALGELEDVVRSATLDIYSGADDERLRRLDADLELAPPEGTPGAPESVAIELSLIFEDLDQAQSVEAPEQSRPLSELLGRFGIDASSLGGAIRGGIGGGALPQAGGDPGGPSGGSAQEYYDCLSEAGPAEEVQKCAELLQ